MVYEILSDEELGGRFKNSAKTRRLVSQRRKDDEFTVSAGVRSDASAASTRYVSAREQSTNA